MCEGGGGGGAPCDAARWSGVACGGSNDERGEPGVAAASNNARTTSTRPLAAATCSGVVVGTLGVDAPASSIASGTTRCDVTSDAQSSDGVSPLASTNVVGSTFFVVVVVDDDAADDVPRSSRAQSSAASTVLITKMYKNELVREHARV
jgi:hypothetical protein